MNKRIIYLMIISFLFVCPVIVGATTVNSNVWFGRDKNVCISNYQDADMFIDKDTYFSHCMEAKCSNNNYAISYYVNNKVTCKNGNTSPYSKFVKTGCDNYRSAVCNTGDVKYCSIIIYYDCSRISTGAKYLTTTKKVTKKRTTKIKTTTTVPIINTRLKSLSLSSGNLDFNSENYDYNINVDSTVNSINVTAVPEDGSSKVEVSGNTNIVNGSIIRVVVTGSDNSTSEYKITVTKEEPVVLSNNAKLKALSISGYPIAFNQSITNYSVTIDKDVKNLTIDYEVEDDKAVAVITGNENLIDGSVVSITVTAEDGSNMFYNINVTVKKDSNFVKIIFVVILVLAVLFGMYYLYKKLIASKMGDKYEYE